MVIAPAKCKSREHELTRMLQGAMGPRGLRTSIDKESTPPQSIFPSLGVQTISQGMRNCYFIKDIIIKYIIFFTRHLTGNYPSINITE